MPAGQACIFILSHHHGMHHVCALGTEYDLDCLSAIDSYVVAALKQSGQDLHSSLCIPDDHISMDR